MDHQQGHFYEKEQLLQLSNHQEMSPETRGDQQPEQEPELDPEFSYRGRSLSRSRSGKFFKKPDQEPEPELCYGSFSFELSFAYVRKIEQNSI